MSTDDKVTILLATMNGATYLAAQMRSYCEQTYSNWDLLVSDDGSTDGTLEIIRTFGNEVPQHVTIQHGPGQGFCRNFMSLVRAQNLNAAYFAYSDQDDIWLPEKLEDAVQWLRTHPSEVPALYFTRTISITHHGKRIGFSPLFKRQPSFQNALVQNIGGGNTMVFNRAARALLLNTPPGVELVSHDWWTYQIVTAAGGIAHYDPQPSVEYRQHDRNIVGSNAGARAKWLRLLAFLNGRVVAWNAVNISALNSQRESLIASSLLTLDRFAAARDVSLPRRLVFVWRSGVYRQTLLENIGLFVGALLGRL